MGREKDGYDMMWDAVAAAQQTNDPEELAKLQRMHKLGKAFNQVQVEMDMEKRKKKK
jgi:hypothetical protein